MCPLNDFASRPVHDQVPWLSQPDTGVDVRIRRMAVKAKPRESSVILDSRLRKGYKVLDVSRPLSFSSAQW